jgi:predicted dehydrogenase
MDGRPLRGALVGFGFIGAHGHLPAYAAEAALRRADRRFELVAVADVCAARRERARVSLPSARVYAGHQELFARESGTLDFVDIATPPCDHAAIAHDALARGLHVLCEKPLATTAGDARCLLAHARHARRVLLPCHNYRHAPVLRCVRRILDEGRVGPPHLVTLSTFRTSHARGVREWRPDWRRDRTCSGGGVGMDHGSHSFYLAFDWLAAYPESISATTATTAPFDTEDDLSCTMRFPGGRLAVVHMTWRAGMRRVLYTAHGPRGAVRVEDDEIDTVVLATPAKPDGRPASESVRASAASLWADASHTAWYRSVLDDFANAVRLHDYTGVDAEDALHAVATIEAAYRSAAAASREVAIPGPHDRGRARAEAFAAPTRPTRRAS